MLVNSYNHSFKLPLIITRGNNVYGPNQYPEKVIPKYIKQLKNNEKITIRAMDTSSCFLHEYCQCIYCNFRKRNYWRNMAIGCDENINIVSCR